MHTYKINKLPKNTVEIQLIIPKEDIKKEYDAVFIKLQNDLEVEGFRKGKAPRSIAEKILTKETVFKELLSPLLSRLYEEIVKKENLKPIITPRVELVKAKENEDWEIK
ncbi:MAG: Trigger factor, partial [Candidatus Roizmanbacteria bacterium GW2011_GWA2_36_23]